MYLCSVKGVSKNSPKLWYSFPKEIDVSRSGCYYAMEKANVAAVQRTWGLYESGTHSDESTKDLKYGQSFDYDEFMALPTGRLFSTLVSVILLGGVLLLAIFPPVCPFCVDAHPTMINVYVYVFRQDGLPSICFPKHAESLTRSAR